MQKKKGGGYSKKERSEDRGLWGGLQMRCENSRKGNGDEGKEECKMEMRSYNRHREIKSERRTNKKLTKNVCQVRLRKAGE